MKFHILLLLFIIFALVPALAYSQASRTAGVAAFRSGDYSKAIEVLKAVVKKDPADSMAWYLLGSAYLKKDKNKDAVKALESAVKLEPKNDTYLTGLAFAYLLTGNRKARATAANAVAANAKNIDAQYILGRLDLLDGRYDSANSAAEAIIALKPDYASAYRLKGEALLGSFAAQSGTVVKRPEERSALLSEAKDNFEKYLSLIPDDARRKELAVEVETLKAFAEYIARKKGSLDIAAPDPGRTPIEIVEKPRPGYTDEARRNNVQGTIQLLVALQSDGTIGRILVLKGLGGGLNQQAVTAARKIKFKPATENGIPVASLRIIEYTFSIY